MKYILTEQEYLWENFFKTSEYFVKNSKVSTMNLDDFALNVSLNVALDFLNALNSLYHTLIKCRNEKFVYRNEKFLSMYNKSLLWIVEMEVLNITDALCDFTESKSCIRKIKLQVKRSLKYPLKEIKM
jgi:hypothetical protein